MNFLIYLAIGAVVGLVASWIMHTNSWLGLLIDIIVGIVGAFLTGYFVNPLLDIGTMNDAITISTLLVTLAGSTVMLWIVKAVHRQPYQY